jgi:ribose transport system substrate-binding protein
MTGKLLLLLALTFSLGAFGCNRQTDGGGAAGGKKRVGVTLYNREHQFYRDLEAGLVEEAKARGFELVIQSGDKDLAKQQSQIETFILQKMDAIIVCPADSQGIGPAIQRANAANIPVFTADIKGLGGKVASHVASNNVQGGRLAAEYIAKLLPGGGEVGVIGQPEVQSTIDREKGFKEELAKYPNLKLAGVVNGGGFIDSAFKAAGDLFQANPNIKAVFCINDDSALGALRALESRGRKDVFIIGFDATPEAIKAIKSGGPFKADVAQLPREIGAKTIEAVADLLAGKQPAAEINVPVKIVDATNAP